MTVAERLAARWHTPATSLNLIKLQLDADVRSYGQVLRDHTALPLVEQETRRAHHAALRFWSEAMAAKSKGGTNAT